MPWKHCQQSSEPCSPVCWNRGIADSFQALVSERKGNLWIPQNVTCFSLLSRLSDMWYFFRCDAALEISVADFISARYVRKSNGEIPFVVVGEVCLTAFSFRQCRIYPPFLQVREQGRRRQLYDVKLLETRLGGRLPVKRERHRMDMWCLGTKKRITLVSDNLQGFLVFTKEIMIINKECVIRFMFLALKKLITLW